MARLTLIIPVEDNDSQPASLLQALARRPDAELDILLAPRSERVAAALERSALASLDPRARILATEGRHVSSLALWNSAVLAAEGDWISVVRPDDTFESEAVSVADFVKSKLPSVDAITWNIFQIAPDAEVGKSSSVAVPTKFDVMPYDKTDILKAFFLWEDSVNVPRLPFGLYHGIVAREFAQGVAQTIQSSGRQHDLPQWEWAARTILMAETFVYCMRPLSAINAVPYAIPETFECLPDFPFHAGLGQTGAIAEIQYSVFAEMGALWSGSHENFVRALMIDCMLEADQTAYVAKCDAYFAALKQWEGGQWANLFRPQFAGERPLDLRRGLHGTLLMVDRHIGKAGNAQQFYDIVRHFLVPVGILCGGQTI